MSLGRWAIVAAIVLALSLLPLAYAGKLSLKQAQLCD